MLARAEVADATSGGQEVRLVLLGGFRLLVGGDPVPLSAGAQRLVALVALHRRPAARSAVAGTLWPDTAPARGAANLRACLRRLPRPSERRLLVADGDDLALPPGVEVDLWRLEDELRRIPDRRTPDGTQHPPSVDVATLGAELLPGWGEEWALLERERHRQRGLHALERLAAALTREGRYDEALAAALAAVASEPLRESAHRAVVEVHLAEANHAEALRQFQTYRRLVHDELGLRPSPAIRRLVAPLLGRPADRDDQAA